MKKLDCYQYLFEIREKGINVDSYIKEIAGHESIPSDVIRFINENTSTTEFSVYNEIYSKRYKNKLYKNLMNENQSRCEKAIALSSYITKVLIGINKLGEDQDEINKILSEYDVDSVISALRNYSNGINCDEIDEVFNNVKSKFKDLYPGNKKKGDE